MESALNAVFEVLSFGAIIVLVVLGLGIIASMMGIFNFAHGEFVLLGAYTTYLVYGVGMPVWVGMLAAPIVVAACGLVLERLVIRRFYAAPIAAMLATYALGLVIRESIRGLIGGLYISVPEPIVGSLAIGGVQVAKWRLAIVIITALGDGLQLSAVDANVVWAARSRGAGEPFPGARFRNLHQSHLCRHLHLRCGARRTRRRAGRAGVLALGGSRHPLPHSEFPRGHARRYRHVRGPDRRGRCDRGDECRSAVGRGASARRCPRLRHRHRFRQSSGREA